VREEVVVVLHTCFPVSWLSCRLYSSFMSHTTSTPFPAPHPIVLQCWWMLGVLTLVVDMN
jgi:hypothetical protein